MKTLTLFGAALCAVIVGSLPGCGDRSGTKPSSRYATTYDGRRNGYRDSGALRVEPFTMKALRHGAKRFVCPGGMMAFRMTLTGCESIRTVNVSPERCIPCAEGFEAIAAGINVSCADPLSTAHEDVAAMLNQEKVFHVAAVHWTADAELLVVAEIVEDTHHAEEMVAADGAFTDRYEYTVALRAVLKREQDTIGVYEATGKYRAEAPKPGSVPAAEARQSAWDHALRLLAAKMKFDRERIVDGLGKQR